MSEKWCGTCQSHKKLTDFNKNKARKDGLNSICRSCSNERSRKYYAENQALHSKNVYKNNQRYRNNARDFIQSVKKEYGCALCDESEPCCLDFHHLNPDTKDYEVARMIGHSRSIPAISTEINKCVCLCANCHRKVHAGLLKVYKKDLCKV